MASLPRLKQAKRERDLGGQPEPVGAPAHGNVLKCCFWAGTGINNYVESYVTCESEAGSRIKVNGRSEQIRRHEVVVNPNKPTSVIAGLTERSPPTSHGPLHLHSPLAPLPDPHPAATWPRARARDEGPGRRDTHQGRPALITGGKGSSLTGVGAGRH